MLIEQCNGPARQSRLHLQTYLTVRKRKIETNRECSILGQEDRNPGVRDRPAYDGSANREFPKGCMRRTAPTGTMELLALHKPSDDRNRMLLCAPIVQQRLPQLPCCSASGYGVMLVIDRRSARCKPVQGGFALQMHMLPNAVDCHAHKGMRTPAVSALGARKHQLVCVLGDLSILVLINSAGSQ